MILSIVPRKGLEGYSEDAKNDPEYGFDGGFECRVWAAVYGAEDPPCFEVGDGLLNGPSDVVDVSVVFFVVRGEVSARWGPDWCGETSSDVALVSDDLGRVEAGEDVVGVEGCHVIGAAGQWAGDPVESPQCVGDDLDVDAGVVVLDRVQAGLVGPVVTGQDGAVDQEGGVGGDVCQGGDVLLEGVGQEGGDCGDGSADGGLGHAMAFGEFGLHVVAPEVLQSHHQCFQKTQDRRDGVLLGMVVQFLEQGVALVDGEACAIIHVAVHSSRVSFQDLSYRNELPLCV